MSSFWNMSDEQLRRWREANEKANPPLTVVEMPEPDMSGPGAGMKSLVKEFGKIPTLPRPGEETEGEGD